MQWFRFYSDALDDPKVQRLPGDLFKTWVNLLCLASKSEAGGTLPSPEDCAFALRMDFDTYTAHMSQLLERGLIDAFDDHLTPHNWSGRQKASDDVTARVRQHREKVKQDETLQKRSGNALDKNRVEKNRVEKSRSLEGADAPQQPASPRPVAPVQRTKDDPSRANPLWDALVAGIGVTPTTSAERSVYGKAVRELRDLDATPDDVLQHCAHYRATWPNVDLTPPALMKHWSRMEHAPPIRPSPNGQHRPGLTERNLAALKEAF